jgi:hypothetical protein
VAQKTSIIKSEWRYDDAKFNSQRFIKVTSKLSRLLDGISRWRSYCYDLLVAYLWNWVRPRNLGRVTASGGSFPLLNADENLRTPDASFIGA